jgi:ubiquinone biosynthesis protein UbiJ
MLTQDVRMIRAVIHDMGETRVTEGEIVALHEDINRVQRGLNELATRVEILEGQRN